ncbi:MAG: HEPN domain-containing protein [Gemmataceae bacterium]|nr:HEPN domain-containing protein [Gemmataceae bacterium]
MAGRRFLDVAHALLAGQSEYYWRSAVVDAYYALFLECRDALLSWGQTPTKGQNVHAWARLKFAYSSSTDLKNIAFVLDKLVRLRNNASYDLSATVMFSAPATAQDAIDTAEQALAVLDQIQADSAREKAAIASLPP